jgi:FAD:protein FMN transferase
MEFETFRAMNTEIVLAAEGDPKRIEAGFKAARRFIDTREQRFTRFNDESELSQLNHSSGSWFSASKEMFEVVNLALKAVDWTEGLFDPGMLKALEHAGYDRSMDEIRKLGWLPGRGDEWVLGPSVHEISLDETTHSIWMPADLTLDLGGIAKGWIAEKAARLLFRYVESCAVSAGGDMYLCGLPSGEFHWEIELEDPFYPEKTLGVVKVNGGSVATSSTTKRRWIQGDQERHHLIDPRTGKPAESEWVSVSVCAEHAAEAEVFAKAILIGGGQAADRLAVVFPKAVYLAVDRQGALWGSKNFSEVINVIKSEYAETI